MELCSTEGIRIQVRQVKRWLLAARQDRDAGIRFLHASYAAGNLDILRQVASDQQIREASGENPVALLTEASAIQDEAQRVLRPVLA
ncbi:MAG: hypothetical protein ACREKK_02730 [Candidatus Methylomirabilales bacterium]